LFKCWTKNDGKNDDLKKAKIGNLKVSIQLTNLIVNVFFSALGIYYYSILPPRSEVTNVVFGWNDQAIFSSSMFGYQIWSFLMEIFIMRKINGMLLHHFFAGCTSLITIICSISFRYDGHFYFGMVELSSVPLAFVNIMKNNPSLMEKHTKLYFYLRLSFAVSFLILRIFMFIPRMANFQRLAYFLSGQCPSFNCFFPLMVFRLCGIVLVFLQCVWGIKIVRGIFKAFLPKRYKQN